MKKAGEYEGVMYVVATKTSFTNGLCVMPHIPI